MLLRTEKLEKWYGGKKIFENISFAVNNGDKAGIIGVNGVGKTSLLNILSKRDSEYKGAYYLTDKNLSIYYGMQKAEFNDKDTVIQTILNYNSNVAINEDHINRAKMILKRAGFDEGSMSKTIGQMSGGMITKITLAIAMYLEPDLLILDEPNNYLDMEQLDILEKFLIAYKGTVILVTHDRKLLDQVCNHIIELNKDTCRTYRGGYSDYLRQKEIERREQQIRYEKYKNEKDKLIQTIIKHKEWFKSAHDAAGQNDFLRAKAKKHANVFKSKEKALLKLESNKVQKPRDVRKIKLSFDKSLSEANILLRAYSISRSYGNQTILNDINFTLKKGERYCLLGNNGSGKTSLLNIICGIDKDYYGELRINPNLRIAYYRQLHENLNLNNTILEEVKEMGVNSNEARLLLGCLFIQKNDVFKKVEELSIGERSKLSVLKIILTCADLLILDEPTNHMDIYTKEIVEQALKDFDGTILFVSHDRYFIEKISTRILAIEQRKLVEYPGGYDYYVEKKNRHVKNKEKTSTINSYHNKMVLENRLSYLLGRISESNISLSEKALLENEYGKVIEELKKVRD